MRPLAALLGALLAVSCSSSSSSEPPPPCEGVAPDAAEACFTDAYFQGFEAQSFSACPDFAASAEKIGGRREIGLHKSRSISHEQVTTEGRFLQRYYAPYDLTFFTRAAASTVGFSYALSGTNAEFIQASVDAGVLPGKTPTAEQREKLDELVGNILFRDLRAFVRVLAIEPSRVDVVVLEHIASPDVQSQLAGSGVIAGLGLSPVLFRNIAADDANKDLFAALALPDDFAATLFVGHEDIVRIAQNPEGIVAHEMGHALGLQHTQEPGNLMTQYQANERCIPGLTADQIAQLRGTAMRVSASESWQRVLDVKRTIVERLVSGR